MTQSLLKAEHVKISFGNVHALKDVSWRFFQARSTVWREKMAVENQRLSKLYPACIKGMAEL